IVLSPVMKLAPPYSWPSESDVDRIDTIAPAAKKDKVPLIVVATTHHSQDRNRAPRLSAVRARFLFICVSSFAPRVSLHPPVLGRPSLRCAQGQALVVRG